MTHAWANHDVTTKNSSCWMSGKKTEIYTKETIKPENNFQFFYCI